MELENSENGFHQKKNEFERRKGEKRTKLFNNEMELLKSLDGEWSKRAESLRRIGSFAPPDGFSLHWLSDTPVPEETFILNSDLLGSRLAIQLGDRRGTLIKIVCETVSGLCKWLPFSHLNSIALAIWRPLLLCLRVTNKVIAGSANHCFLSLFRNSSLTSHLIKGETNLFVMLKEGAKDSHHLIRSSCILYLSNLLSDSAAIIQKEKREGEEKRERGEEEEEEEEEGREKRVLSIAGKILIGSLMDSHASVRASGQTGVRELQKHWPNILEAHIPPNPSHLDRLQSALLSPLSLSSLSPGEMKREKGTKERERERERGEEEEEKEERGREKEGEKGK
mmetsp:Transcript_41924/g.58602  ORF Transcript_41924/g.58602 Transcript_41924/m.58602 type:complete len:338 (+) Transcript_41924:87-1100(+)